MPAKAFISYSHNDEKMLTALHKHLAVMKREKTISTWYDRDILAGGRVHGDIVDALTSSELFLALVSPDYVNSTYCYDKEFQQALSRNSAGTMQIVPIAIEPCDWISTPFAQFKALPKDGAAVSLWSNQNSAWLDVITELRRLVKVGTVIRSRASAAILSGAAPRNPRQSSPVRIKRDFDVIDRGEFRDRAFKAIRTHFKTNVRTVAAASNLLRAKFEDMGPTAFTCTLVNRGRSRGAESHITVHNEKSRGGMGDIPTRLRHMIIPEAGTDGYRWMPTSMRCTLRRPLFPFDGDGRTKRSFPRKQLRKFCGRIFVNALEWKHDGTCKISMLELR